MQTRLFASAFALFLVLAAAPSGARATLLEYWDFNNDHTIFNSSPSTFGAFSTDGTGVSNGNGNGEIYNATTKSISSNTASGAVFNNGSLNLGGLAATTHANGGATSSAPVWGVYSNSVGGVTTTNQAASDPTFTTATSGTAATNNGSLGMVNVANEVDTLVFSLSSTGYTSLTLSAAERFSAANLATISWSYSTDGTTWTSFSTTAPTGTNFSVLSLNLPSNLSDLSTFYIEEVATFGSTVGSFAIDNVQLNGTALAVPEPSTYAFLALGGGMLLRRLRRLRASGIAC